MDYKQRRISTIGQEKNRNVPAGSGKSLEEFPGDQWTSSILCAYIQVHRRYARPGKQGSVAYARRIYLKTINSN